MPTSLPNAAAAAQSRSRQESGDGVNEVFNPFGDEEGDKREAPDLSRTPKLRDSPQGRIELNPFDESDNDEGPEITSPAAAAPPAAVHVAFMASSNPFEDSSPAPVDGHSFNGIPNPFADDAPVPARSPSQQLQQAASFNPFADDAAASPKGVSRAASGGGNPFADSPSGNPFG